MTQHRLFIGFRLPPPIADRLVAVQRRLREHETSTSARPSTRWTKRENLHLTVRYLGPTDSEALPALVRDLTRAVRRHHPLSLALTDIGYFPDHRTPQVLWVGLDAISGSADVPGSADAPGTGLDRLRQLRSDMDALAADHGYPPDPLGFTPHITLAYLRDTDLSQGAPRPTGLPERLADDDRFSHDVPDDHLLLDTLTLFASTSGQEGPVYTDVAAIKLG